MHDLNHRATLVFIPKSPIHCAHKATKSIAWHMPELHGNLNYFSNYWFKSITIYGKFKKFDIGDYILVSLCQGRFPQGMLNNLQARDTEYLEILSKVGVNRFVIDLPDDWKIDYTFSIKDLVYYKGSLTYSSKAFFETAMVPYHVITKSTPKIFLEPSTR